MTYIFSDKEIDGLSGIYYNVKFYVGIPPKTTLAYADDKRVIEEAKRKGIKCLSLNAKPLLDKVEAPKDNNDDDIDNLLKPYVPEPTLAESAVIEEAPKKVLSPAEKAKITRAKNKAKKESKKG